MKTTKLPPGSSKKPVRTSKMISAAKLPSLLKKSYTQEKLTKKILNKIYIPADKDFVRQFFTVERADKAVQTVSSANKTSSKQTHRAPAQQMLAIPRDTQIAAKDFNRLKLIAKEVKRQKFGIKLIPLAAVVGAIAALCIVVSVFKNTLVKRAIVSGMQAVFQAKTDIGHLDFDIFGAKLQIKDLQQANKNDVMKNIFQVGEITFDFNLTELLRGKFDAENLTIADVLTGTERTTSGYIPPKKSREEQNNSSFIADMQQKLVADVQKTLTDTFADYNPENIINNVQANLKSPAMAEAARATIEPLLAKWKDAPSQMETAVTSFAQSVDKLVKTDWANMRDVATLRQALADVNDAVSRGKTIKSETEKIATDFKTDTASVTHLSRDIANAIASDKALIDGEINKFKTLKAEGVSGIFNKTLNAFMYNLLGTYYPYVQKGIDVALTLKSNTGEKSSEKKSQKIKTARRSRGRTVYYRKDTVPRFLIENAFGSGATWSVSAKEISSDPDKRGKPAELATDFTVGGIANAFKAVIDGRSAPGTQLVTADYTGTGFPIALNINDNFLLDASSSTISCGINGNTDGSFGLRGGINMSAMKIATPSFEPHAVYTIYQKALNQFTALKVNFDVQYAAATSDMSLSIDTNAGTQFAAIFQNLLVSELTAITASAREKVDALLAEKTGGISEKLLQFTDIQNSINTQQANFANTNAQLETIRAQITKQLANQAGGDVQQKATDALKGLFGR